MAQGLVVTLKFKFLSAFILFSDFDFLTQLKIFAEFLVSILLSSTNVVVYIRRFLGFQLPNRKYQQ